MRTSLVRWSVAIPATLGVVVLERRVLAVDRGLDATDEAFYLLAAGVTDRNVSWSFFPFHWHTRPLLLLAGYDIAWFRTLGALALLGSALVLAIALNSLTANRADVVRRTALAISLPVASHLYYAAMLRTPSYNLLNLVGMVLAAAGIAFASSVARPAEGWSWPASRGAILIAAGLVLAAPARPSTPILGLGLVAGTVAATLGIQAAVRVTTRVVGLMIVAILLLTATGVWSRTPWRVVIRGLRAPALAPEQTVLGALADAGTVPLQATQMLIGLPAWRVIGPLLLGIILALASQGFIKRVSGATLALFGITLLAAHRTAPIPPPWRGPVADAYYPGWASESLTAALVLVTLAGVSAATMTALLARRRDVSLSGLAGDEFRRDVIIACSLLLWPVLFGFGSANGAYGMIAHAGVFLIGATLLLVRHVRHRAGRVLDFGVPVMTALLTASVIAGGWHAPYRLAPLREHTVAVSVFPDRPKSVLHLDAATAATIDAIREVTSLAGWTREDRLLVVSPPWGVLEPLVLGARPVNSVMITLHGYPGSSAVGEYSLSLLDESWRDAWVLTTIPAGSRWDSEIAELQSDMMVASGRRFPDGYICVAEHAGYRVYRPRSDGEPTRGDLC